MAIESEDKLLFRPKGDRLVTGSIFSLIAMITTRVATIFNAIVIIRVLGPADYGVLSIVILTISLASIAANFQTPQALVKFLASTSNDRPEETNRLLGAGFALTIFSTVLTLIVLVILTPILAFSVYNDSRLEWLLLLALISLVLSSIFSPLLSTFRAFERIKELGIRNTVASLLSIPSTLILVFYFKLEGAVMAMVLNAVIAIIVNLALLRNIWTSRRLKLEIPRTRSVYLKIANFAIPAFFSSVVVAALFWFCGTLLSNGGAWFVELGRYSAGYGLAGYILFISASIAVPLVPMISRLNQEDPKDMPGFVIRTLRVGAFLTLPLTLILIAMPEPFLRILYGSPFVAGATVVRFVAPAIFLASIANLVGSGMAGTGQMKSALLLNLIWAIPLAIMAITFIPIWRENGLAFAIFVAYAIQFTSTLAFIKFSWHVELKLLAPLLLIALIAIPTATLISFYVGLGRLLLAVIFITAVFIAGLSVMSKRELEVLGQPFSKFFSRFSRRD